MSINTQSIVAGVRKYPIVVVSSVLSIVLLATLYFRSDLLSEQRADLEKYTEENDRYRSNISNSAQLQEQLSFLIQANKAVANRALSAEGLAQNLQYFYRLESEVGVKYLDLRPIGRAAPKPAKGAAAVAYVPLGYVVNVQGDFTKIITYLRRLEQGVYFCRINSASISGGGSTVTLNLNLDLLGTQ